MMTSSPGPRSAKCRKGIPGSHVMRRDADVAAGARHGRTRDVPRASAELGQGGALYDGELPARAERRDLDDGEDLPCAGPRRHLAALWAGGRLTPETARSFLGLVQLLLGGMLARPGERVPDTVDAQAQDDHPGDNQEPGSNLRDLHLSSQRTGADTFSARPPGSLPAPPSAGDQLQRRQAHEDQGHADDRITQDADPGDGEKTDRTGSSSSSTVHLFHLPVITP